MTGLGCSADMAEVFLGVQKSVLGYYEETEHKREEENFVDNSNSCVPPLPASVHLLMKLYTS